MSGVKLRLLGIVWVFILPALVPRLLDRDVKSCPRLMPSLFTLLCLRSGFVAAARSSASLASLRRSASVLLSISSCARSNASSTSFVVSTFLYSSCSAVIWPKVAVAGSLPRLFNQNTNRLPPRFNMS